MEQKNKGRKKVSFGNLIILIALVVLIALFYLLNPNFLNSYNVLSMMQSLAPYAIMALGVTFVIATGGIDLSIGTTCIAAAVVAGKFYTTGAYPLWAVIPIMIAIGTAVGLLNGVLIGLFWVLGFMLICMYLMYKNRIGRYILSIGSNEEATRLSGINTDKYKIIAYVFSGCAAGIAAIFWSAAFPTVAAATGNGMELDAIAGVYIGGTSAAGGVASVTGSAIGSLMLVVIRSGLNFVLARFNINLNATYVTYVLTGIIVVVSVLMDVLKNKDEGRVRVDKKKIKKEEGGQTQTK